MSAIIGVCGINFCAFISDKRKVRNGPKGIQIVSDNFEKVFKINDRVLFGATGWFEEDESILAPLDVYPNKDVVTMRMALGEVLRYVERRKARINLDRNYLIGGKDNKGSFCIYEVRVQANPFSVQGVNRTPQPPEYNFAVSCVLPPSLSSHEEDYLNHVGKCINSSSSLNGLLTGVKGIVRKMADQDKSVGRKIMDVRII